MDRHIVITGASSGLGAAMAKFFLRSGSRVTMVARREAPMQDIADSFPKHSLVLSSDLCSTEHNQKWIGQAEETFGAIDVLINNAGIQVVGPTHTFAPAQARRTLYLNLGFPLELVGSILPKMLEADSGHIVNIASMAALAPTPFMTHYNASKAGLAAASESLRGELKRSKVGVTTVYPGIIPATKLARDTMSTYASSKMLDLQPTGTPERLAELVYKAVEHDRARVIYPRANVLARHFPALTRMLMDRFTPDLR